MNPLDTLAAKRASLASGKATSRELVEASLAAATDPSGEGVRTFTRIYVGLAGQAADAIDKQHQYVVSARPLLGIPISIKDLFDVAGEPTPAGSTVLADAPPARKDAEAINRLRVAGAVLVGRKLPSSHSLGWESIHTTAHRAIHTHQRMVAFRVAHPPALLYR